MGWQSGSRPGLKGGPATVHEKSCNAAVGRSRPGAGSDSRASELIVNQASTPPATARLAQASSAKWEPWTIAPGS